MHHAHTASEAQNARPRRSTNSGLHTSRTQLKGRYRGAVVAQLCDRNGGSCCRSGTKRTFFVLSGYEERVEKRSESNSSLGSSAIYTPASFAPGRHSRVLAPSWGSSCGRGKANTSTDCVLFRRQTNTFCLQKNVIFLIFFIKKAWCLLVGMNCDVEGR